MCRPPPGVHSNGKTSKAPPHLSKTLLELALCVIVITYLEKVFLTLRTHQQLMPPTVASKLGRLPKFPRGDSLSSWPKTHVRVLSENRVSIFPRRTKRARAQGSPSGVHGSGWSQVDRQYPREHDRRALYCLRTSSDRHFFLFSLARLDCHFSLA